MNNLYIWILLTLPTFIEVTCDYIDHKKGKRDKKGLDVIIRGAFMLWFAFLSMALGAPSIWQSFLLSASIFTLTFDPIMGYLLTKRLNFLGTTSKSDMLLKKIPLELLWIGRGLIFVIGVLTYYLL